MAARHKRAKGGRTYYEGGESNVAKEAAERKHGGRTKAYKDGGSVPGFKSGGRLDKMGRASGGRTGCDKSPFSSAKMG